MTNAVVITVVLSFSLANMGCEEKRTPATGAAARLPAPTAPNASQPAPSATGGSSLPPATAPSAAGSTVQALGLSFAVPAGWKQVPPASAMRLAEIQVVDGSGDPAKTCSVAFSTAGGEVQANIDRWAGQVRDASGQPSKPTIEKKTVNGLGVTVAEMTGAYAGMGEPAPHANWTLRGAIVETPSGLLFVKMTGPAEQMAAAKPAFSGMIDSVHKP